jgi:hypothetical protein
LVNWVGWGVVTEGSRTVPSFPTESFYRCQQARPSNAALHGGSRGVDRGVGEPPGSPAIAQANRTRRNRIDYLDQVAVQRTVDDGLLPTASTAPPHAGGDRALEHTPSNISLHWLAQGSKSFNGSEARRSGHLEPSDGNGVLPSVSLPLHPAALSRFAYPIRRPDQANRATAGTSASSIGVADSTGCQSHLAGLRRSGKDPASVRPTPCCIRVRFVPSPPKWFGCSVLAKFTRGEGIPPW